MWQKIKETETYFRNLGISYDIAYYRGQRINTEKTVLAHSKSNKKKRYVLADLKRAKFIAFIIDNPNQYGLAWLDSKIEKIEYTHIHKSESSYILFMNFAVPPKEMCWVDENGNPCILLSINEYVSFLRNNNSIETNTGTISFNLNNGSLDYWVSGFVENKLSQRYVILNEKAQKFIPKGNEDYNESLSGIQTQKKLNRELRDN